MSNFNIAKILNRNLLTVQGRFFHKMLMPCLINLKNRYEATKFLPNFDLKKILLSVKPQNKKQIENETADSKGIINDQKITKNSVPSIKDLIETNPYSKTLTEISNSKFPIVDIEQFADENDVAEKIDLRKNLPPITIDGIDLEDDDNDNLERHIPKVEEVIEKRVGVYQSHGIKIYIPDNQMNPGTCRHNIRTLPKDVPDDMRVIHYH